MRTRALSFAIAVVALGVSTYLTVVHYTAPLSLSCPNTGVINCAKVTTSSQSELLGFLPVSLAGLLFYVAMVGVLGWRLRGGGRDLDRWALAGAISSMLMVLYLVYVEAVQLHAFCLWCTAVHVLTLAFFVTTASSALLDDRET